jgi:Type II secretion system (T2SS), protein E, N-terminal domain
MGYEAVSLSIAEHTTHLYAYETIETIESIAARVQSITTTCGDQLALVSIMLGFESEGKSSGDRPLFTDANASTIYLLDSLRPLVRKTDVVFLLGYTCYFLLPGANLQGGQIVQSRLWDALLWRIHNAGDGEILHPHSIVSGYSAYPAPYRDIDEFVEAACNVNLRSNFTSEKPARKAVTKQARTPQQNVTDEDFPALARKLGIPYLSLLPRKPPERIQQLVNPRLAQELRCYPLGRERNKLTVAMLNPQDHLVLERLQKETGLDIFPVLTHPRELQTALEQLV